MKTLFLGQNIIAEKCLDLLTKRIKRPLNVTGLVSNEVLWRKFESRLSGDVTYISNEARNEEQIIDLIKTQKIEGLISVQHPWILSSNILKAVNYFAFNLHNAKLPEYKGYNTISHAILNRDSDYTTTIHWIVDEVDTGDIAFEATVPIHPEDTAFSLYNKTVQKAVQNFQELINALIGRNAIPKRSLEGKGRFYKRTEITKLKKIEEPVNWQEVYTKYRAFYFPPHEPAYYLADGRKVYVKTNLDQFYS